ncbi:hypothetical protein JPSP35_24880 [Staphylococcus pseudintermedius]
MLFSIQQGAKRKSGRTLLSDINWQVNEGECWLVYGLNGAGKTTLLNMINAYDFLTAGERDSIIWHGSRSTWLFGTSCS